MQILGVECKCDETTWPTELSPYDPAKPWCYLVEVQMTEEEAGGADSKRSVVVGPFVSQEEAQRKGLDWVKRFVNQIYEVAAEMNLEVIPQVDA